MIKHIIKIMINTTNNKDLRRYLKLITNSHWQTIFIYHNLKFHLKLYEIEKSNKSSHLSKCFFSCLETIIIIIKEVY